MGSASASPWAGRSSGSRRRSSWTSRSRTSTPSFASGCARHSRSSTSSSGVTTVYVTHDQVEAMTLGQRVAVMRDGHILQVDTPQTLYEQPLRPLRRRLHRLAGDESRRGDDRRRRGRVRAAPRPARPLRRRPGSSSGAGHPRHPSRDVRGRGVRVARAADDRRRGRRARGARLGRARVLPRRRDARSPRRRSRRRTDDGSGPRHRSRLAPQRARRPADDCARRRARFASRSTRRASTSSTRDRGVAPRARRSANDRADCLARASEPASWS